MSRAPHIGQACSVACRFCGRKLVVGRREFDHFEKEDVFGSSAIVYRVMAVCPKRLVKFSFTYFLHDLREFNEDCTVEYKV